MIERPGFKIRWYVIKRKQFDVEMMTKYNLSQGWGNGYVLIPRGHPWYGVDYDQISCDVHGG